MEIRILRYFWTVATVGTFSKAAELLYITQPTLSRQIKELEELDTQLFIREGRKVILTEDGQFLKIKAEEILTLESNTSRVFADRKNAELTGHLTIGALEGFTADSIAKTLRVLRNEHPKIRFSIYSGNADEIKSRIDSGLVDVGFILEPASTEKYHVERLNIKEHWVFLTQRDNPLAQLEAVTFENLANEPLLISQRHEVRQYFAEWAKGKIEDFNIIGGFNLGFNLFPLVNEGVASAIVTEGALREGFPNIVTRPLNPDILTQSVLAWKKNVPLSPVTRAFIKLYLYE
ncbi:LysR family transcriptional regulator [Lactococcus fujiensis]|uniref:LysR family transcriptional regulator n=1 Tax=Lactococcus fujiensis JCM 16395 TaxID=1291764 RepID=A0A2A5RJZ9_9LACT|nr:LysR family transcriptional regulator [Lactococcus fujiensis]PCR99479.1 LysR family transcriptional regulator [Lactococcus fujiensis JCM 16395]